MPYTIQYDFDHRLLLVTYSDPFGDADLIESYDPTGRAVAELGVKSGIIDFSQLKSFDVSVDTVRLLAAKPTNFPDPIPRCIVCGSDLSYGMSRMFQIAGGDTRNTLHIVRTLEEAYRVLKMASEPQFQIVGLEKDPRVSAAED